LEDIMKLVRILLVAATAFCLMAADPQTKGAATKKGAAKSESSAAASKSAAKTETGGAMIDINTAQSGPAQDSTGHRRRHRQEDCGRAPLRE
jgi:hypothetical protein